MEHEVTALDQFSLFGDLIYRVIWLVMIVLSALYVVGNVGMGWVVIAAIACCIFKTIVGLFNYCAIVDIIHYYCDLITALVVGWGIGNWFNFYKVGFYEFSVTNYIVPIAFIVVLAIFKRIIPNKRSYKKFFI